MTPRAFLALAGGVLITLVLAAVAVPVLLIPGTVRFVDRTLVPLWARLVLRIAGVTFAVEGREQIPGGPVVFVVNHRSNFDIPVLWLALGRPVRFVAKRELVRIPVFGWALRLLGHVIVDRGDSVAARATMARAAERVRGGVTVLVFAEGTRGRPEMIAREGLAPFKKGGIVLALQAGVPIVPVAISGTERILPRRTLRIRPGHVCVVVGTAMPTAGFTEEDRTWLTEEARARVRALLLREPAAAAAPASAGAA